MTFKKMIIFSLSISILLTVKAQTKITLTPAPAPAPAPTVSKKPLDWGGCMPQCIDICMGLHQATQTACDIACVSGCQQLIGKGSSVDGEFDVD
ncbi:hypothetical protein RND81_08G175400 [Saponaria officinalis]|uniref:Uncharacterized protein n=1 Tax=Saponaria officinalis TaxID=3572 RepID=A0AAW1J8J2_SAPOF